MPHQPTRVDGHIMKIHYTEGQVVKEGDPLVDIDPRPFQVQLEQAEGNQARDQALLANAKIDLQRYTVLFSQDAIPKQQLDTQTAMVNQIVQWDGESGRQHDLIVCVGSLSSEKDQHTLLRAMTRASLEVAIGI